MEHCPCCKSRLRKRTICPRCQADLSHLIDSEQSARIWLSNAIHYWRENKTKQSLDALELSIHLKKTKLAIAFRGFLIEQQYQAIVHQLEKKQIRVAKNQLYNIQALLPYSLLLQQLNSFTDYLLLKKS